MGFFARSVDDLELLADVFNISDRKPSIPRSLTVENLRIAFAKTHVWPKAGPGLKAVWEKAMQLLTRHGANVEEIDLPGEFAKLQDWHMNILSGEGRAAFLGSKLALFLLVWGI